MIDAAIEKAREMGIPARVLTFEPHPRAFFHPNAIPFRLTPPESKERLLKSCGIDDVVTLPFNEKLASMTAQDFIENILIEAYGAQHVVAGHDFVFGHKRGGTMKILAQALAPHGIGVTEVEELGDEGEDISSSRVRELLLEGDVETAAKILGHPWTIEGTVVKGKGLGAQTLGYPTANVELGPYLRPKLGVYAVQAGPAGKPLTHLGVANIGIKPTVGEKTENLEAFLFDFDKNIYGQPWQFALVSFIRPERKFETLDALKEQIAKDVSAAKKIGKAKAGRPEP